MEKINLSPVVSCDYKNCARFLCLLYKLMFC